MGKSLQKAWILVLFLCPATVLADGPWHMISFGRDGAGWNGTVEHIDSHSNSDFKNVEYFLNDISLNYAYRVFPKIQVGSFYSGSHSEFKFKNRGGGSSSADIEINTAGIFVLYNFIEDLNDSWYSGYAYSVSSYEEENSKDFEAAEEKAPFELDDVASSHEIILGKRFSLRSMKVDNLSFSPEIRFFYRSHGKDFDDQKVGNGRGISLRLIKLDLLF